MLSQSLPPAAYRRPRCKLLPAWGANTTPSLLRTERWLTRDWVVMPPWNLSAFQRINNLSKCSKIKWKRNLPWLQSPAIHASRVHACLHHMTWHQPQPTHYPSGWPINQWLATQEAEISTSSSKQKLYGGDWVTYLFFQNYFTCFTFYSRRGSISTFFSKSGPLNKMR